MNDLGEKLADILNDPESMENLSHLAESFLGSQNGEQTADSSPLGDFNLPDLGELQSIISIMGKIKSGGNDPRTQLLTALKPHLSEPRQKKVDTAIKILKVIEILPLVKDSGLLNL